MRCVGQAQQLASDWCLLMSNLVVINLVVQQLIEGQAGTTPFLCCPLSTTQAQQRAFTIWYKHAEAVAANKADPNRAFDVSTVPSIPNAGNC